MMKTARTDVQHRAEREPAELQTGQVVHDQTHVSQCAIDAQRAASVLCPECNRGFAENHRPGCVLRPVMTYEEYQRFLRTDRPEEYWGRYAFYLTD